MLRVKKRRWYSVTFIALAVFFVLWKFSTIEDASKALAQGNSSHPWAGVPALVREANGSTTFWYQNNDNYGRPLALLDMYKKRFDWPPREYVTLNHDTDVSRGHVFVTGASENHFVELLSALNSIKHFTPGVKIIVWDLGLSGNSSIQIQSQRDVEYRKLNFSAYPEHVRHLTNYAFKPVALAETMKDYPRVVWMDSSVHFTKTGDLRHIKAQMLRTGGVLGMLSVWHSIFSATHPQLYEYFPTVMEKVKEKGIVGGGCLVFYRTETVFKNIFLFWVLCSLDVRCIEPTKTIDCDMQKMYKGEYGGCHRFDQSVISILMGNKYNYDRNLYRDYMSKGEDGNFVEVVRAGSNLTQRTYIQSNILFFFIINFISWYIHMMYT